MRSSSSSITYTQDLLQICPPALLAVLAGAGWALGQLGKRYGAVEKQANKHEETPAHSWTTQVVIDSVVALAYIIGQGLPAVLLVAANFQISKTGLGDDFWHRMPACMSLGIVEGLGDLFSVMAISLAAEHSLTVLAMAIMNSIYAGSSPVILAITFKEQLGFDKAVSYALLFFGVYLSSDLSADVKSTGQRSYLLLAAICILSALCWGIGGIGYRLANQDPRKDIEFMWATASLAMAHVAMVTCPSVLAMVTPILAGEIGRAHV
eukprot:TRINITY_DN54863_c0_g1_i1.p1 TRINITY_DN54863_c0_g1~~TRINITY_DN54863_c0_g1_i1.p1  ORF type:complete len:265 (+),score=32.55 TRINITY_DN54863_c0_g1_i1:46-840(+)